jgi:predicted AAA+ superfamily ATPase
MRGVQENLRLSTSQNQKIMKELNDYKDRMANNDQETENMKRKIQKLLQENSGLGD